MSLTVACNSAFRMMSRCGLGALLLVAGTSAHARAATTVSSGVVSAWGDNTYGELGGGHEGWQYDSKVPVPVSGLSGVRSVADGGSFGLALKEGGTVMAWGNNGAGELGDGTTTQRDAPVAVSGLSRVTAIAAGESHSLALLEDGTVVAWGYDNFGQLGNGVTAGSKTCDSGVPCSTAPVRVPGLSDVKAIAAGGNYSLALLSDGTVMAWGEGQWGQLGDGESPESSDTPVKVKGLSGVKAISAGASDALALLEDGAVMVWGVNGSGQLGDGTTTGPELCVNEVACSRIPVVVSGLSGVSAVAAGGLHSLALLSDGTVDAWGYNIVGQLGDGTTTNSAVPVSVSGLSGVTTIAAGKYDSLALLGGGTVVAWGWNILWELGNISANEESLLPIPVSGLSGVTAISAGEDLSLAVGASPAPLPQVTAVKPGGGGDGTTVTITGLNFDGATAVDFGSTKAAGFTVDSETSITAFSPSGAGTVDVTVTTPEGVSYTSPRDLYHYEPASGEPPECEEWRSLRKTKCEDRLVIENEHVPRISEHEATLEAQIDTSETGKIEYIFEYGATTAYGKSAPSPPGMAGPWVTCGLPCEGETNTATVSIDLKGLEPGTIYHYRLVATDGHGTLSHGEDATFTTEAPSKETESEQVAEPLSGRGVPLTAAGEEHGASTTSSAPRQSSSTPNGTTPLVSVLTKPSKPVSTRAQWRARALRVCRKKQKSRRRACENRVRTKHGPRPQ